jgi:hypothetical protein
MSPELDKLLCQTYPEIFINRKASPSVTSMCWGFSCGDGWFSLIKTLCESIQWRIKSREQNIEWAEKFNQGLREARNDNWENWPVYASKEPRTIPEPIEQVVATQVKEKFGGLRFYYTGGDDYIRGLVDFAETMSYQICEECGAQGCRSSKSGYIVTTCGNH